MLSPTSPAPKNLSGEDSSGSDAGSEVGPEPETDRFGFILTNGSTAGSVGPPPELVRQRETKWINIISQWDRMLLKKTSKVKVQCQKGIPASLRAKCWPLLCGATDRTKLNENLYQTLDSQPALQSWVDVIERDLDRQFPFHEMFLSKDGHGQRGLFRVLKAYTQYQPEEGYCQAQGPVAAVLLMNMPAEEAFWCLVQISEQYLPGYYSPLLEGVLFDAAMLNWVLKRTCPAAHKHLQHHEVEPLMFATDWLMCLFTRHLPFNTLLRVWDLFFCYGVRVLLQVAVVLVRRVLGRAEQRKQCPGQMETLERLRGVREEVHEEDDTFIAEVCSVQLSARDLDKQTEKELEKWRKDKPTSTFDPRGRCHGYRMAWARARQNEAERDRRERESGNLSVPLARSASTLSLSPSLLHKRWRKGGGGGGGVVRHVSMGAKEDWRSWSELHFKKVQGVQEEEDAVFEEHKKQGETKLKGKTERKELKKIEIQNVPTGNVEETVIVTKTRITGKEKHKVKETKKSKSLSEQPAETKQSKDQTAEHKQREELDSISLEQVLEQPKTKHLDTEVKDRKEKETEKQVETRMTGKEKIKMVSEQMEETEQTKDQTVENILEEHLEIVVEDRKDTETEEVAESKHTNTVEENQVDADADRNTELDSYSQSQVLEQQHFDIEVEDTKETEKQVETGVTGEKKSEKTHAETEQTKAKDQTVKNILEHKQEEEHLESVVKEQETEEQVAESKHTNTVEENQTEIPGAGADKNTELDSYSQSQVLAQQHFDTEVKDTKDTGITGEEKSQLKETEESKMLSEQKEDIHAETEQTTAKEPNVEHILQPAGHQQGEEQLESVVKDRKEKETEKQVETRMTGKEKIRMVSEQMEETEQTKDQTVENILEELLEIVVEDRKDTETEEVAESKHTDTVEENQVDADADRNTELDSYSQSQVVEQQHFDIEVEDTKDKETEKQEETKVTGEEQSQLKETEEMLSRQEEKNAETEQTKEQTVENILEHKQAEEHLEIVAKDRKDRGTEKQEAENSPEDADADKTTEVEMQESEEEMIQKPAERTETENEQQVEPTETNPCSETDGRVEATTVKEVITETDKSDPNAGKYRSAESLSESDVTEECHTQTQTETDDLAQSQEQVDDNAATQDEAEKAETLCSPECIQPRESSEACEKECERTQEEEEGCSEDKDQTQAEETPTETETNDSTAPPLTQAEAVTLVAEHDGSSVETSEEPAPEPPSSQVTVGAAKEEESKETVPGNTAGKDDVFTSTEPKNSDSNPKDSHQAEVENSESTHRSSRTSADFCVRKSPGSRGSRLARRLSEDLFTTPEKPKTDHADVKHCEKQSNPAAVKQNNPSEKTAVQPPPPDPPKRFGLFRRLRGEQPKKPPKMQVPKILIQDFSDGTGTGKVVEDDGEEKLSSRERRRRRRERERIEKEEERSRKKREKELEKERRKPQTRGKSSQKGSGDVTQPAKTGAPTLRYSASFTESYF